WKHHALVLISYVKNLRNRRSLLVPLRGFTLAEVLITLGIIGVVAALTIPTLMQKTRQHQTLTAIKKFISTMENAIKLSEVENGETLKWEKGEMLLLENGDVDIESKKNVSTQFFTKYLAPYLKYTGTEYNEEGNLVVTFADGSNMVFNNGSCMDTIFDTNGKKLPNQRGKDIYVYLICTDEASKNLYCASNKRTFCPYDGVHTTNRDYYVYLCSEVDTRYCARLLEMDGYEFKDDYPFKF
ncbi:type II secretion system protein, partial [bacterium]|nr:type II secretion system protein [bacterium]